MGKVTRRVPFLVILGAIVATAPLGCSTKELPVTAYQAENRSDSLYFVSITARTAGASVYLPPHSSSDVVAARDLDPATGVVYTPGCREVDRIELGQRAGRVLVIEPTGALTTAFQLPGSAALDGLRNGLGAGVDCRAEAGWWIGARNDSRNLRHVEVFNRSITIPAHTRTIIWHETGRPFPADLSAVVFDAACLPLTNVALDSGHRVVAIGADDTVSAQRGDVFWKTTPAASEMWSRPQTSPCATASRSSP